MQDSIVREEAFLEMPLVEIIRLIKFACFTFFFKK